VLLVEPDAEPPVMVGVDEDWVRMPANDADVRARAARLGRFAEHLHGDEPYVDRQRILHRAGASIPLSATEAAIMNLLLRHRGTIVPIADLEREVWHGNPLSRDAIDAAIYRLRRRLSGLSLVIRAVRNRGFVIHLDAAA
jgi:DNA-binding response OmpR family regulator